jgi:hypothetical protein
MPKILIITGDAAESLEVMYPYQRLLEEGYVHHGDTPLPMSNNSLCHISGGISHYRGESAAQTFKREA